MRPKLILSVLLALVVGGLLYLVFQPADRPRASTIRVLGEDSSNLSAFKTAAPDFERKTGVTVEFHAATYEQATEKADQDFRGKTGLYDIVLQYNFSLAPYVRGRSVYAISDPVFGNAEDAKGVEFFENALKETSFYYSVPHDRSSPPSQFGYPFAANTLVLVYNAELFGDPAIRQAFKDEHHRELGVPATWQEYLVTAQFMNSKRSGLHGVSVQGASEGWLYYEVATYLGSMGTGVYKKDNGWEEGAALTLDSEPNRKALEYLEQLVQVSAGDVFTTDALAQRQLLLKGTAAMGLVWSDYLVPLSEARDANGKARFSFAPIPGKVSPLAGGAFYINRASADPRRAMEFVRFLLLPDNQEAMLKNGLCSPVRSAYTADVLRTVPYAPALRDSLERGVYMFEAGSTAQVVSNSITTHVQAFLRGQTGAAEALRRAAEEIQKAPPTTF